MEKVPKAGEHMQELKEMIPFIRNCYKTGDRVELVKMDDVQAPPIGTKGTVVGVDDIGTIHVDWDNGSSLGIVFGEDVCRLIHEES